MEASGRTRRRHAAGQRANGVALGRKGRAGCARRGGVLGGRHLAHRRRARVRSGCDQREGAVAQRQQRNRGHAAAASVHVLSQWRRVTRLPCRDARPRIRRDGPSGACGFRQKDRAFPLFPPEPLRRQNALGRGRRRRGRDRLGLLQRRLRVRYGHWPHLSQGRQVGVVERRPEERPQTDGQASQARTPGHRGHPRWLYPIRRGKGIRFHARAENVPTYARGRLSAKAPEAPRAHDRERPSDEKPVVTPNPEPDRVACRRRQDRGPGHARQRLASGLRHRQDHVVCSGRRRCPINGRGWGPPLRQHGQGHNLLFQRSSRRPNRSHQAEPGRAPLSRRWPRGASRG